MSRAAIPSPTAEPSCLVDPERTSPAAKTPAMDVSMVGLVTRNPPASRSTASPRNPLLGFIPMNTKTAAAGNRRISWLSRSRATTAVNRPRLPSSLTMSAPVRMANCGSDRTGVDIVKLEGSRGAFTAVVARDRDSQETLRFPAAAVFVFIGMKPNNGFLGEAVERDVGGFLVTSPTMETSMAGVFAAGDVRSGSTKQLGSAVGDGIAALLMTRRDLEAHRHKAVSLVPAWK